MRISGGLGVFKKIAASKTDKKIGNNPFASNPFGLSFKGKLQGSDLFESQKSGIKERALAFKGRIADKGRLVASATVGALTHIQSAFKARMDATFGPIIVFAQKTSEQISKITDTVSNFKASDLKISNLIREEKHPNLSKTAKRLLQRMPEVDDLAALWESKLAQA